MQNPQFNPQMDPMFMPQYSVQQSSFQSPPVLYSQSQPMMVTNQNNMTYQMVNLGAGAMMQRLKQRQEEEMLIDMLAKQNELITKLTEDMNWRMDQKQKDMEEELEQLERKVIIARQKKAEQDYLYKLNRQLTFGLERIKEQELKKLIFPKVVQLGVRVPSIAQHEQLEQVYPMRAYKRVQVEEEVQANADLEFSNPYGPYAQLNPDYLQGKYQPQFKPDMPTTSKRLSQKSLQSLPQKSPILRSNMSQRSQQSQQTYQSQKSKPPAQQVDDSLQ